MPNAVLSDKFEGSVTVVTFENTDGTLGEGDAKSIFLAVAELNLVAGLEVGLRVAAIADADEIVLAHLDAKDFRNELNLFLRVIVEGDWLTEGVHVVIRKRLFRE